MKNKLFSQAIRPLLSRLMFLFTLLLFLLNAGILPSVGAPKRGFLDLSLEFVNAYELPKQEFQGTPVGGLSAIAYDPESANKAEPRSFRFYALSDDRSEKAPARFYTLKLTFQTDKQNKTAIENVAIENVTFLKDANGQTYAKGSIDPEGMALSPGRSLFISSEGVTNRGIPAFIDEFDLKTGAWKSSLPIPTRYLPDPTGKEARGIQDNLGFEALTIAKSAPGDPFRVFAATESSLEQDKDASIATKGAKSRFLHYSLGIGPPLVVSEHLYPVDPPPTLGMTGLSELLVIGQGGQFLSLERSYGLGGFGIQIFQIATGSASDISSIASLAGISSSGLQPIRKQLLLDLRSLGIRLDNLEGMTLGPRLPDRSQSLILVSDDNFNDKQVTQFLLFRLRQGR